MASDEIKSASFNLLLGRFHPRSGFIPTKADLVEKTKKSYQFLGLFLVRETGL
jgi:hypothetical protein